MESSLRLGQDLLLGLLANMVYICQQLVVSVFLKGLLISDHLVRRPGTH